jgi:hypothetical protein
VDFEKCQYLLQQSVSMRVQRPRPNSQNA